MADIENMDENLNLENRVATHQGKVREWFIFSRSENCQGIWKNVMEILERGKCQGISYKNFEKVYYVKIFIHKITWFLNYKLKFLSF